MLVCKTIQGLIPPTATDRSADDRAKRVDESLHLLVTEASGSGAPDSLVLEKFTHRPDASVPKNAVERPPHGLR
jgi:hypothetical protein